MAATKLSRGYRREAHDSLPSTSSEALEQARNGAPGGLWVTARVQTRGRGRRGRSWSTEAGNLAASLLLIEAGPTTVAATVSFAAGLAIHQSVLDLAGPATSADLKLKWPNDLLLARRKIAGILVEGEKLRDGRFALVIGIGVNCHSHPEVDATYQSGDLSSAGLRIEPEQLFERLTVNMADEIDRWDQGRGFETIRSAWLERAIGVGEVIKVNLPDRTIDGSFETLDNDGRLVLNRVDGGRETISAGDLYFSGNG